MSIYVCMHVDVDVSVYVYVCMCMCSHVYVYEYMCMWMWTWTYMYVCVWVVHMLCLHVLTDMINQILPSTCTYVRGCMHPCVRAWGDTCICSCTTGYNRFW